MKNIIFILSISLFFVSCSTNSKQNESKTVTLDKATIEKTIADNVTTDKRGSKFDMKFKVIDMKEPVKYTVADSIKYLKEKNLTTELYNGRNETDVLALIVECRYSIVPPMMNTEVEEAYKFILTPDANRCIERRKVK